MSQYTIEICPEDGDVQQWEEGLSFDPTAPSLDVSAFIRRVAWEKKATFRPIDTEAEPHYEGWLRYEINICPEERA